MADGTRRLELLPMWPGRTFGVIAWQLDSTNRSENDLSYVIFQPPWRACGRRGAIPRYHGSADEEQNRGDWPKPLTQTGRRPLNCFRQLSPSLSR